MPPLLCRRPHVMDRFYLRAGCAFALIQAVAVVAHFSGPSPYGGPLVEEPMRLIPEGIMVSGALVGFVTLIFSAIESAVGRKAPRDALRVRLRQIYLIVIAAYTIANQIDLEIVRWLGQHVNVSFIRNFFGIKDRHLLSRILGSDIGPTALALSFVAATLAALARLWRRTKQPQHGGSVVLSISAWVIVALAFALAFGMRHSEKRWRRVRPAIVGIASDLWADLTQANTPHNRPQALLDLLSVVKQGTLAPPAATLSDFADDPTYPFAQRANPSHSSPAAFRQLPRSSRPNLVFIVFETLRGWKTGLSHAQDLGLTPELDALIKNEAAYFPWVHSNGFPSVEGCMSLHLGIWPDYQRIIFSDFVHLRTRAWPEILRSAGYYTFALLGADPSFSSFTPWIRRWYHEHEYRPENRHDGPLVDRFIEKYDELTRNREQAVAMTIWTATTHPPYDVPESEGVVLADTSEGRYDQAVMYSQRHVVRLVDYLRRRDDWDNTVVVIVGDHSQPTPYQRANPDKVCHISPGHSWTNLAILGGWAGLPPPGPRPHLLSHIDIAPTLLGVLSLSSPHHFMGRDASTLPATTREAMTAQDGEPAVPAFSFRYGDVVWQTKHQRICFSPLHSTVQSQALDPTSRDGFGLLTPQSERPQPALPTDFDLERYRDLVRAYSEVLHEDRIFPANWSL